MLNPVGGIKLEVGLLNSSGRVNASGQIFSSTKKAKLAKCESKEREGRAWSGGKSVGWLCRSTFCQE